MTRRFVFLMTLLVALSACASDSPTEPSSPGTAAELRATPTSITSEGKTLRLDTDIWRDFMPMSPPDGKPLVVIARVKTSDGSAVPAAFRATDIWLVHDDDVWSTSAIEERPRQETPSVYEVVGRDGPKWGPGVDVDVIVRITDGSRVSFLRAANQPISATH